MPTAQTILAAYWAQAESSIAQPRGEGMRIKRLMIALTRLVGEDVDDRALLTNRDVPAFGADDA